MSIYLSIYQAIYLSCAAMNIVALAFSLLCVKCANASAARLRGCVLSASQDKSGNSKKMKIKKIVLEV